MERGAGAPIILGNIFFTVLGIFALKLGGWNGVAIMALAALYFPLSTSVLILAGSGGLRDVLLAITDRTFRVLEIMIIISWRKWQHNTGLAMHGDDQELIEIIPSEYKSFVPAQIPTRQSVRQQARGWLMGLCNERTGELDPNKVHDTGDTRSAGWLKIKAPTGDVRDYLLKRDLLVPRANGFAVNINKVGNSRDIEQVFQE
jgi:hypothetical protein